MRLRPATPADADAIAAIIQAAFAPDQHLLRPASSALRETPETIAAQLRAHQGFVAQAGDRLLASVWFRRQPDALEVARLAVAPAAQGQGLARALLAEGERLARAAGLDRLRLNYRLPLTRNRRLYEGCGFIEIGRGAHPGCAAPTFAIMEKRLIAEGPAR